MLQAEKLRWFRLQRMISGVSKKTILEYAAVADAVTDPQLMGTCMQYLLKTKDTYGMPGVKCDKC